MVKKINDFVDLERRETGVTESATEENKSDSGSSETDNKECISECQSIEVAGSSPEGEVTTVQSSISKEELTKVVENVSEPPVLPLGQAEELPVTQVIDQAGINTDIQEQDPGNIKSTEQQGPVVGLSEIRVKRVDDTNGSQNTEYMNIALLEPPTVFRDAEEVPVAQVKETGKGCSDSERNECQGQDTEEGDEDGSSQETYCSESR